MASDASLAKIAVEIPRGFLLLDQLSHFAATRLIAHRAAKGETMWDYYLHHARWAPEAPVIPEEDWAALRRLRDTTPLDARDWHYALDYLPCRPFCPEDRAFVDRAMVALQAGEFEDGAGPATALVVSGSVEDVPLVERLTLQEDSRPELLAIMRRRLGLEQPGRARGKGKVAKGVAGEWMDGEDLGTGWSCSAIGLGARSA